MLKHFTDLLLGKYRVSTKKRLITSHYLVSLWSCPYAPKTMVLLYDYTVNYTLHYTVLYTIVFYYCTLTTATLVMYTLQVLLMKFPER